MQKAEQELLYGNSAQTFGENAKERRISSPEEDHKMQGMNSNTWNKFFIFISCRRQRSDTENLGLMIE